MHAALSATSLSDTVGIAALLGLVLAAFHLADTPRRAGPWLALAVAALIGTSIRFEFWLALPLVTLHHLARIRSLARTALVALAMAPFPALWLAERASQGGLAAAYADAISGAAYVGAHSVDLVTGAANAAATLVALMGGPLVWLGLLGLATLPLRLHRPGPWPDRALPLALLALETLFLAKFAADRGARSGRATSRPSWSCCCHSRPARSRCASAPPPCAPPRPPWPWRPPATPPGRAHRTSTSSAPSPTRPARQLPGSPCGPATRRSS